MAEVRSLTDLFFDIDFKDLVLLFDKWICMPCLLTVVPILEVVFCETNIDDRAAVKEESDE